MGIGLKGSGLKGFAVAAALAMTGLGAGFGMTPAAEAAQTAPPTAAPVDVAATNAAAPATAAPTSPELAMDGAPAMTAQPMIGQPTDGLFGLQPQVTENGRRAHHFHNVILVPVIVAISLLVLFLLMWVVFRYRAAANPVPSKTSHNTLIEVLWTLIPVVILALIAIPSIGLLAAQYKPAPAGAVTLKAIGNQWYWSYQYPDNGGFEITANMLKEKDQVAAGDRYRTAADGPRLLATDARVVLPVGVPIRLITTSMDVIHSWAMPAFWIKLDAVPGRLNETSFTIEKPGVYFGQCSELCGARHGFMPIAVEAVSPAEFAAWVKAKGGTMPTPGQASNKVIPQPGADAADATATAPEGAVPAGNSALENTTATPPVVTQGATQSAPVGNVGR
ncbi:MAG: cytochrome c oxidase subunit II [Sphingomonas bacterium]|nr:cytochrome c oxidase subunit II [Sphingomonas bacterium]